MWGWTPISPPLVLPLGYSRRGSESPNTLVCHVFSFAPIFFSLRRYPPRATFLNQVLQVPTYRETLKEDLTHCFVAFYGRSPSPPFFFEALRTYFSLLLVFVFFLSLLCSSSPPPHFLLGACPFLSCNVFPCFSPFFFLIYFLHGTFLLSLLKRVFSLLTLSFLFPLSFFPYVSCGLRFAGRFHPLSFCAPPHAKLALLRLFPPPPLLLGQFPPLVTLRQLYVTAGFSSFPLQCLWERFEV